MSDGMNFNDAIGALWLKTSKKGNKFMSGEIEINGTKHSVVIFKNDKGGVEARPDYRIFPSKPKEQTAPVRNDFEDDIPF